jgi:hypothetical protein
MKVLGKMIKSMVSLLQLWSEVTILLESIFKMTYVNKMVLALNSELYEVLNINTEEDRVKG